MEDCARILRQIEGVLDERVRPVLKLHGGDVEGAEFADGVFRFRFAGTCAGCPSALLTAEQLVRAALTEAVPQVRDVVAVVGVSQGLVDQARDILDGKRP